MDSNQPTLHVGRPNIGDRQLFDQLVDEMFRRRWFTNYGQLVQQFERRLCEYLEVKHCIPVCNATVGLEICCHALELKGEVIVPAYTFVATPHAVQWVGLKPIFADVNLQTHNLDPAQIERRISKQTSAILGVHVWGRPCDTSQIETIASRHGLQVFYDAAHAFGSRHEGRMIGNFGRCEVFSFHATKFFNTFEGGAIATNDDALALRLRQMKNFGFAGLDEIVSPGTNGKMTEVSAAMGLASFADLQRFVEANRKNSQIYHDELRGILGIRLMEYHDVEQTNWQYIVVEVESPPNLDNRDRVYEALRNKGILARRYFHPGCHRMEPYRTLYRDEIGQFPHTDQLCRTVLCLPNGTEVSPADIRRVCAVVRQTMQSA